MATASGSGSRSQSNVETDPRYQALREFVRGELKHIQSAWTARRNDAGTQRAVEIPAIRDWYGDLGPDDRRRAHSLFGKINQLSFDTDDQRRGLLKSSVIAFETFKYRENLDAIDQITTENLDALRSIFQSLDDLEATLYHQILRERIKVVDAMRSKIEENAKEKVIQEHVFDHLWLLDPAWERATETPYMEQTISAEFDRIDAGLTEEEKAGRVDIKYRKVTGKHVVVELKRADVVVSVFDLAAQINKYRTALQKFLAETGRSHEPLEFVCIVGRPVREWAQPDGQKLVEETLQPLNARVVLYQELIDGAYRQYQEFIERNKAAGRVARLLEAIDEWEMEAEPAPQ